MKNLIRVLLAGVLVIGGASIASATAYDWHFPVQDDMDSPTTIDLAPSGTDYQFVMNNPSTHQPELWGFTDPSQLTFHTDTKTIDINGLDIMDTGHLTEALADLQTNIDTGDATLNSAITTTNTNLSTTNSTLSTHISNESTTNSIQNQNILNLTSSLATTSFIYYNNVATTTSRRMVFNGTTSGGTVVFYLTTDGTSSGTPICKNGNIGHVNVIANDPSNTFGIGWALTNSNKTLTITANVRSFSATTILGISVLGSSSLTAAANGTDISAMVICN